ncbi:hypothetical protein M8J76_014510 [Diaphorina citri]|nr:hypothetical protein M8J75_013143 [Diaphorina citri]KAI5745824.1 hypothetical protein M8J76_014510 [Diaphorina citri]KAI5752862.1 hypothetical protein M8J77_021236 [Diaphorina citri]
MASDREVLREVWDGKLPVCFTLLADQVSTVGEPDPSYLMVPRLSYFPLVLEKVKKHFVKFVEAEYQDNEMWLDYNGTPLKWHYPIGLLYDLHVTDNQLPWNITVHFDKFPANEILHCPSREAVESHFMSCIKEADVLKHRSQIVSNMQKKEHNQLWLGLQNDKFDQFWVINKKLMEPGEGGGFKHIPFRCYQGDLPFSQCLVKPITNEGNPKTLQNLFEEVYPKISIDKLSVLVHGIAIPLDTPLQWMSEHLSYPDNFLHIVVNVNS